MDRKMITVFILPGGYSKEEIMFLMLPFFVYKFPSKYKFDIPLLVHDLL